MTILLPFNKTATIIYYKIQGCGTNKMTEGLVRVHVQIIMRCFFLLDLMYSKPNIVSSPTNTLHLNVTHC